MGIVKVMVVAPFGTGQFLETTIFRLCLGNEGLADIHRFLPVLTSAIWTHVPLLQSHFVRSQDTRFLGLSGPSLDYI